MGYKVIENKTANTISNIGFLIFICSFVCMLINIILSLTINRHLIVWGLGIFFISLPMSGILIGISNIFSTRDKDTRLFLNEIRQKIKQAKSINNLNAVREELCKEAIDKNNMIRISFPLSVKEIIKEIDNKIEILESIKH